VQLYPKPMPRNMFDLFCCCISDGAHEIPNQTGGPLQLFHGARPSVERDKLQKYFHLQEEKLKEAVMLQHTPSNGNQQTTEVDNSLGYSLQHEDPILPLPPHTRPSKTPTSLRNPKALIKKRRKETSSSSSSSSEEDNKKLSPVEMIGKTASQYASAFFPAQNDPAPSNKEAEVNIYTENPIAPPVFKGHDWRH